MSWDVISCDEKWTCQKWSCDELGCDKYCAMPLLQSRRLYGLRLPRERQAGSCVYCACHTKPAAAQRRPRAPQLLQETLCTAPATRKAARLASRPAPTCAAAVLCLPRERQPGSSLYCACHASRGPAAPTRAAAPPGGSVDCAGHAKGSQEALCTAPATRSQPRPSGAHARRSSSRRLCVLRRPRERQPGSSLYCACHAKPAAAQRRPRTPQLLQEALCTAPATRKAARNARRRLSIQEALCTAPATRKAARKLSVLRLPREVSE